jgi:hypothetical protein
MTGSFGVDLSMPPSWNTGPQPYSQDVADDQILTSVRAQQVAAGLSMLGSLGSGSVAPAGDVVVVAPSPAQETAVSDQPVPAGPVVAPVGVADTAVDAESSLTDDHVPSEKIDQLYDELVASMASPSTPDDNTLNKMISNLAKQSIKQDDEPADLKALREASINGFGSRDALGVKMGRDKEAMETMKAKRTHHEKAQFRKEWAEAQYKSLQMTKYRDTQFQIVDKNKGELVSFELLIERFGGSNGHKSKTAMTAALKYAMKCYTLGYPFVEHNEMAEIDEFLHFRKQHSETFTRIWGLRSKQTDTSSRPSGKQPTVDTAPGATPTPTATRAGSAAADAAAGDPEAPPAKKQRRGAKGGNDSVPPAKADKKEKQEKKKDPLALAITDASKFKQKYTSVTAQAHSLSQSLTMPSWEWASGSKQVQSFEAAKKEVQNVTNGFFREYMTKDMKDLKNSMEAQELVANLVDMVKIVKPCVDVLETECKRLTALQSAMNKLNTVGSS